MAGRKARLFLGNLPQQSSEADICQRLEEYGIVNSVEIKHKKDIDNETVASTFAYVNIEAEDSTLQQCLRDLRSREWNGCYIKAEIAKESFLKRLQRERDEASKSNLTQNLNPLHGSPKNSNMCSATSVVKEEVGHRKRKISFQEEPDSCKEDELVSKFESFSDFWKDDLPPSNVRSSKRESTVRNLNSYGKHPVKPQIFKEGLVRSKMPNDSGSSVNRSVRSPDFVTVKSQMSIEPVFKSKLPDSDKDPAAIASEMKRLRALEEKNKALKQQKDAIKNALSSIDQVKPSNRIVFDDDGDPVLSTPAVQTKADFVKFGKKDKTNINNFSNEREKASPKVNGQLQLFDEDDENDNWHGDFRFKKQFDGKKGKQLLEMQARFKDDERFVIDERFYESDDENEKTDKTSEAPATEEERKLQEEKAKQMEILASVLGEPVQPSITKKSVFNPMVRFDPFKPSHAKFELPKPNDTKLKSLDIDKKKRTGKSIGEKEQGSEQVENEPLPVDEKQFYKVACNIKELFKKDDKQDQSTETTSFSLRQMFSSNEDDEPKEELEVPNVKPAESNQIKPKATSRPILRGFQGSKPLALFTKKVLRPELDGVTNTFCKGVDVEAIKKQFSEKRRLLGRMLHKKKVVLERQQHFKHKIGAASAAHKSLERESAMRRKFAKPWEKKRSRR